MTSNLPQSQTSDTNKRPTAISQLSRISIHNYVMTLKFYTAYVKFYSKS